MRPIVPVVLLLALTACRSGDDVTLAEVGITDTLPGVPRFDGSLSRAIAVAWQQQPLGHELRTKYVRIDSTPI